MKTSAINKTKGWYWTCLVSFSSLKRFLRFSAPLCFSYSPTKQISEDVKWPGSHQLPGLKRSNSYQKMEHFLLYYNTTRVLSHHRPKIRKEWLFHFWVCGLEVDIVIISLILYGLGDFYIPLDRGAQVLHLFPLNLL